ncbi:MAG: FHA domain-containing protein [Trebonia sp.]
MKVTSCVPLVGQGVIARYGTLVGVTAARGPSPDPLLSALAEAAESAGDGGDLMVRAARAALRCHGRPAWACAGVTADGGVAVQVHGRAVATVRVDGGPEVTLTAGDSATPVNRKFNGATVTLGLAVGATAPPDPHFWLGDGVVCGGGLAVTVTADVPEMAVPVPDTPAAWHPPTLDAPALDAPALDAPAPGTQAPGARASDDDPDAVLVDGVLCARDHFNDPAARACRLCGIGLDQPPGSLRRRPRPPLGVLVFDDGTRFPLDGDYVLGREPAFDSDVIDGRSRPLRINDPNGTVSRLHLRISLVGWQVEVSDLGSANGSVLQSSDGERTLPPHEPTTIEPGARIGIGHRSMQYLAYQGVLP